MTQCNLLAPRSFISSSVKLLATVLALSCDIFFKYVELHTKEDLQTNVSGNVID